jgi:hypothetical protein
MRALTGIALVTLAAAFGLNAHAANDNDKPSMVGTWTLDASRSADKTPSAKQRATTGVHVGVAGMPVPGPQEGQSPVLGTPRDPDVIQAQEFSIDEIEGLVHLRFASREVELTPGEKQGVKTKWAGDRLNTTYWTTRRTVSQDYKLTAPNELTVVVKIDPKDQGATTHTRVFTRKTQ